MTSWKMKQIASNGDTSLNAHDYRKTSVVLIKNKFKNTFLIPLQYSTLHQSGYYRSFGK